jgi:hypothetical protein
VVAIIILMPSDRDSTGAHLHVSTSDRAQGGFSPSSSKIINASSACECYVAKSGYDENRLTKSLNSVTLNTNRKGKLLKHQHTKIHFYIIYQSPQGI